MRSVLNRIASYFFRGLLFTIPLSITIYVLVNAIGWMDGLLQIPIPGIGLLAILVIITLIGYLTNTFITKPLFIYLEKAISKVPLVSLIYSSLKDLIGAFVGDKKKFDKPVLVEFQPGIYKAGFITGENLKALGLEEYVSVYLPHSYNFSGNHFIVKADKVKPLNMGGTDAMKYIVSGGVSSS